MLSQAIKVAPISKRSWLAPVAVAASVALFVGGGAGYTIAAQSGSNVPNVVSAPATEMGGAAGAEDSKMAYWGGRAFLEADSGISDNPAPLPLKNEPVSTLIYPPLTNKLPLN